MTAKEIKNKTELEQNQLTKKQLRLKASSQLKEYLHH